MIKPNQKGFTLVELLFVVLLLAVLGVSVIQVIFFLEATSKTAEETRKEAEVLSNISSLFRTQLLSKGTTNLKSNNTSTSVSAIQRNLIVEAENNSSMILRFSSVLSASFEPGIDGLVGEKEVRYYVDTSKENNPLILEIWPILGNPQKPIYRTEVIKFVSNFKIRQWQGKAWIENWNNPYGGSPRLLEITIRYSDYLNGPTRVMRFSSPLGATS